MRTVELNIHARDGRKWRGKARVGHMELGQPASTELSYSGGVWKFIGLDEFDNPRYLLVFVSDATKIFDHVTELKNVTHC